MGSFLKSLLLFSLSSFSFALFAWPWELSLSSVRLDSALLQSSRYSIHTSPAEAASISSDVAISVFVCEKEVPIIGFSGLLAPFYSQFPALVFVDLLSEILDQARKFEDDDWDQIVKILDDFLTKGVWEAPKFVISSFQEDVLKKQINKTLYQVA